MNNELLPCPFCGGEVGFHKDEDCNGCHYIWCHSCDGMFDLSAKADPENDTETLEELNERIAPIWNNRAQQSAPTQPQIDAVIVPKELIARVIEHAEFVSSAAGYAEDELRALLEAPAVDVSDDELVGSLEDCVGWLDWLYHPDHDDKFKSQLARIKRAKEALAAYRAAQEKK